MISNKFSLEDKKKKLLYSLRSKYYRAKIYFRKQHNGNLKSSFLCNAEETQKHTFENCGPIKARVSTQVDLNNIYGSIEDQFKVVQTLSRIEQVQQSMKESILPGGSARTPVNT